jgi:hypothetical protein
MTCGGRNDALTLRGHCACLVCLSATSSLRTLPPPPPVVRAGELERRFGRGTV